MKIKFDKIIASREALVKFLDENGKMPAEKAFKIAKALKLINNEIEAFDKVRNAKIKEYGEEKEKGNFQVKNENIEKFQDELKPILEKEIDLDIEKIEIKDLKDEIDVKLILPLEWLFNI